MSKYEIDLNTNWLKKVATQYSEFSLYSVPVQSFVWIPCSNCRSNTTTGCKVCTGWSL